MFEGDKVLEKALPRAADHTRPMLFELSVVRGLDPYPDPRDLGIIVPFSGAIEVRRRRKSGRTNGIGWWTAWDSNPRPRRCERRALPAELAAHSSRLLHYNRTRPDVRHPQPDTAAPSAWERRQMKQDHCSLTGWRFDCSCCRFRRFAQYLFIRSETS